MAISIRTSIDALRATRQLAQSSNELSSTFERLASGQRINRASDDAAGLAIADALRVERRLYSAAVRNLSDAMSVVNIVTGTLESQTSIVNRLQELAAQAANGSLSDTQRLTLNQEYQQLVQEFGRSGDSTTFNGLRLLNGNRSSGFAELVVQAGINGGAHSRLSLASGDTGRISGVYDANWLVDPDWSLDSALDGGDILEYSTSYRTRDALMQQLGNKALSIQVTTSSGAQREVLLAFIRDSSLDNAFSIVAFEQQADGTFIGNSQGTTEYVNIVAGGYNYLFDQSTGRLSGNSSYTANTSFGQFTVDLSGLQFQSNPASGGSSIDFSGVDTTQRALAAMDILAARLTELSQLKGRYGAFQSRLEIATSNAYLAELTRTQAESRIRDADIASESARLSRLQILQQAGAAVLAQANNQPQLALQLLR